MYCGVRAKEPISVLVRPAHVYIASIAALPEGCVFIYTHFKYKCEPHCVCGTMIKMCVCVCVQYPTKWTIQNIIQRIMWSAYNAATHNSRGKKIRITKRRMKKSSRIFRLIDYMFCLIGGMLLAVAPISITGNTNICKQTHTKTKEIVLLYIIFTVYKPLGIIGLQKYFVPIWLRYQLIYTNQ